MHQTNFRFIIRIAAGLLYKQVTGTIEQIGYKLIKELKVAGYELKMG